MHSSAEQTTFLINTLYLVAHVVNQQSSELAWLWHYSYTKHLFSVILETYGHFWEGGFVKNAVVFFCPRSPIPFFPTMPIFICKLNIWTNLLLYEGHKNEIGWNLAPFIWQWESAAAALLIFAQHKLVNVYNWGLVNIIEKPNINSCQIQVCTMYGIGQDTRA